MPTRYVVNRPHLDSNVGSNLSSLAGAAWLARASGRTLVVDWRGQRQLLDASANYFTEFFSAPTRLAGVDVEYAAAETRDYSGTAANGVWLSPSEARACAATGELPDVDYVVLQPYHGLDRVYPGSEAERFELLRAFYRDIQPADAIAPRVDAWARVAFGGAFVVGVNLRTGNGAYFGKGMRYAGRVEISIFENRERFLRKIEEACVARARVLPKPLRDRFVVFYATDSEWMSELLARLPNAVTHRRRFPPAGAGDLYASSEAGYSDRDAVVDSVSDMFLLGRCDALVYNSSLFNQYGRVITGYYSGNLVHIETLFPRLRARMFARNVQRHIRRPAR